VGNTAGIVPCRRRRRALPLIAVLSVVPLLVGWHWAKAGWRDWHYNYPATPYGYSQIVNRFGQPCNTNASAVWMTWIASDNGYPYTFRFHRKLGGYPTQMVTGKGGASTNLDNDVYGHIQNNHLYGYTKSGIWGYFCRYIAGTTKWSTHAFGIAVDISSRYEPQGHCYSTVNKYFAYVFKNHGWRSGLDFCDPMHFQYAFGY
jgi:D-alanyl-D-alanine carboxypeptidase